MGAGIERLYERSEVRRQGGAVVKRSVARPQGTPPPAGKHETELGFSITSEDQKSVSCQPIYHLADFLLRPAKNGGNLAGGARSVEQFQDG